MDREKFLRALNKDDKPLDRGRYKRVIRESIESLQDDNPRGHHDLIICMEELAELQQALSKELRGKGDSANILEEFWGLSCPYESMAALERNWDFDKSDVHIIIK